MNKDALQYKFSNNLYMPAHEHPLMYKIQGSSGASDKFQIKPSNLNIAVNKIK